MEQIEIFNENIVLIIKHGDKLIPEERIKYYEAVIHELYVVRSAFKRDLYMEETSIKKQLEKELEKTKQEIDREEMNSDIIRIRTTLSVSDLARIFESLLMTKLISEKTEIKQIMRLFFSSQAIQAKAKQYSNRKNDTILLTNPSEKNDLAEFIKKLLELSYKGKPDILDEIIDHAEKLRR